MSSEETWEYKTILSPTLDDMEISMASISQVTGRGQGIGHAVLKWGQVIDRELNDLGSQGWELIAIWKAQFGDQGACQWMTFKRRTSG